jgi:hypothetical protein
VRRLFPLLLLALAGACASAPEALAAANGLDYTPPAPPPPPDIASLLLRLAGLTAGLLALCAGVLWYARRSTRPAAPKGDGGGRLRHEASLALDRRCSVHIITVDGQTVAVTTDATGLRSMVLLSEPFEAALDAAGSAPPPDEGRAAA